MKHVLKSKRRQAQEAQMARMLKGIDAMLQNIENMQKGLADMKEKIDVKLDFIMRTADALYAKQAAQQEQLDRIEVDVKNLQISQDTQADRENKMVKWMLGTQGD